MRLRLIKPAPRVRHMDMTPMIDVVLQLIIFFMFSSRLGQATRSDRDLPRERGAEAQAAEAAPTVVIDIDAMGGVIVEGRPLPLDAISRIVTREVDRAGGNADAVVVLIRPDRDAAAATLNRLAERLSAAGVRRWRVATRSPENGG